MTETETDVGLPAIVERRRARSFVRATADSGFVSQLIAERDRLPAQREKRQAPVAAAIDAYGQGEQRDARGLPQGFFRTSEA